MEEGLVWSGIVGKGQPSGGLSHARPRRGGSQSMRRGPDDISRGVAICSGLPANLIAHHGLRNSLRNVYPFLPRAKLDLILWMDPGPALALSPLGPPSLKLLSFRAVSQLGCGTTEPSEALWCRKIWGEARRRVRGEDPIIQKGDRAFPSVSTASAPCAPSRPFSENPESSPLIPVLINARTALGVSDRGYKPHFQGGRLSALNAPGRSLAGLVRSFSATRKNLPSLKSAAVEIGRGGMRGLWGVWQH